MDIIGKYWPIVLFSLTVLYALFERFKMVPKLKMEIQNMKECMITSDHCQKCSDHFCKKVDTINSEVNDLKNEIKESNKIAQSHYEVVNKILGTLTEHIRNHP